MKAGIEKQPLFFSSYEQILSELINVPPKKLQDTIFCYFYLLVFARKTKNRYKSIIFAKYFSNMFRMIIFTLYNYLIIYIYINIFGNYV